MFQILCLGEGIKQKNLIGNIMVIIRGKRGWGSQERAKKGKMVMERDMT